MQFNSKATMEIPIEQAFEMLSDFDTYERSALRRGAEVARLDTLGRAAVGAKWDIGFHFRSKARRLELELTEFQPPDEMKFTAHMQGLDSVIELQLVALSRTRTRLNLTTDLAPKTLSARLLVQSLKLARGNITKRFDQRLASHAAELEERFRKTT